MSPSTVVTLCSLEGVCLCNCNVIQLQQIKPAWLAFVHYNITILLLTYVQLIPYWPCVRDSVVYQLLGLKTRERIATADVDKDRILGTPPPDISPLESFLPRPVRTTLAQLRSGHCRLLKLYMACITTGESVVCPECGVAPYSVEHLFNCSAHPTQLTVQDLWDNPAEVADFLNLDSWCQWTRREELLGYHNNNNNNNSLLMWQCWQVERRSHGVYRAEDCRADVWRAAASFSGSGRMDRAAEPGLF